jgi:hypothetical protein
VNDKEGHRKDPGNQSISWRGRDFCFFSFFEERSLWCFGMFKNVIDILQYAIITNRHLQPDSVPLSGDLGVVDNDVICIILMDNSVSIVMLLCVGMCCPFDVGGKWTALTLLAWTALWLLMRRYRHSWFSTGAAVIYYMEQQQHCQQQSSSSNRKEQHE